jgi:hypothetical protein
MGRDDVQKRDTHFAQYCTYFKQDRGIKSCAFGPAQQIYLLRHKAICAEWHLKFDLSHNFKKNENLHLLVRMAEFRPSGWHRI